MDLRDGALGVVVAPRRADPLGERDVDREADLAVLVLDVELDRVEACCLHRDVLLELSGYAGERHRHVDAANLDGQRPRLQDLRPGGLLLVDCCAHGLVSTDMRGDHPSDDSCRDQCEQDACRDQALLVPTLARLGTP